MIDTAQKKSFQKDVSFGSEWLEAEELFLPAETFQNEAIDLSAAQNRDSEPDILHRSMEFLEPESLVGIYLDGETIRRPIFPTKASRYKITATGHRVEWEGVVEEVHDDSFSARLLGIRGLPSQKEEFAEFELISVPHGDRHLIQPGGIFRWILGIEARAGTRQKYSRVVFRRLPAWSERSLKASENRFKEVVSGIDWADEDYPG